MLHAGKNLKKITQQIDRVLFTQALINATNIKRLPAMCQSLWLTRGYMSEHNTVLHSSCLQSSETDEQGRYLGGMQSLL